MHIDVAKWQRKQELKEDYDRLVRWREALEQSVTIDSRHLTEIDKLLAEHQLLTPKMEFAIRRRAIYLLWLTYREADPRLKREILLILRELHDALPQSDEYADSFWRWLEEFQEEEAANGEKPLSCPASALVRQN
jgi:hypothetical protein